MKSEINSLKVLLKGYFSKPYSNTHINIHTIQRFPKKFYGVKLLLFFDTLPKILVSCIFL